MISASPYLTMAWRWHGHADPGRALATISCYAPYTPGILTSRNRTHIWTRRLVHVQVHVQVRSSKLIRRRQCPRPLIAFSLRFRSCTGMSVLPVCPGFIDGSAVHSLVMSKLMMATFLIGYLSTRLIGDLPCTVTGMHIGSWRCASQSLCKLCAHVQC